MTEDDKTEKKQGTFPPTPFPVRPGAAMPARPAADPKLRQQLLRRVVDDNVAAAQPIPPSPAARPASGPRPARLAAVALAGLLVVFGFWLGLRPAEPSGKRASAPAAAAPLAEGAAGTGTAGETGGPELIAGQLKPVSADVFGLGVHRILLDPGHGGSDTGTTGGGLVEKDLTLDIALRTKAHLDRAGFEVLMTRTSDLKLELRERSEMANLLDAHLFVSVHLNYLPGGRATRGVETYFVGHTDDPELLELARRENAHSGYDMASNNQLLQKLFSDARQQNSRLFATRVQQLLYSSLKPANPELVDRGVKQAPFVVLVGTKMPAILAEVACLSSSQDMELLGRPLYRESIAEALARGIRRYAEDMNPPQEKGS